MHNIKIYTYSKKNLLGWKVKENDAKVESDPKNANNPKVDSTCMEHLEKKNIE